MSRPAHNQDKIQIGFKQSIGILIPYAKRKVLDQVKSVALIILYLFFFQAVVLRMPIAEASTIAVGLAIVIGGLAFFMEGLILGLMPLGEVIGLKLPQKTNVFVILGFGFILGVGVTFAEPAIGVLKSAGAAVKPWEAPLLFLMLNKHPDYLVYAVGVGVGIAVLFSMLRYLHNWSLKPFIYILVLLLLLLSGWAYVDPNLRAITGLAWDCGAVTTGPVTVPLVLALGLGVCRVASKSETESLGFGVVTLASLFPVVTVLFLAAILSHGVPAPMSQHAFFQPENRQKIISLFRNPQELTGCALQGGSEDQQLTLFEGNREEMLDFLRSLARDEGKRKEVFGQDPNALYRWAAIKGTEEQKATIFGDDETAGNLWKGSDRSRPSLDYPDLIKRNALVSVQAVLPLVFFLLLVLSLVLREKLQRADEIFIGVLFALLGMMLFNIGIEIGLAKLGNQVGQRLPSSFKAIEVPEQKTVIESFDPSIVQTALDEKGQEHRFFFLKRGNAVETLTFDETMYHPDENKYVHIPRKGPIMGRENGLLGISIVLVFAFVMGYGATLAEPALNALGITVEEMTVGTFKKSLLMHAVAFGVGAGITMGVLKIVCAVPLFLLLAPPYVLLLFLTRISTEEFVNIGWDSAGVTTGPVTVPLVLAMGLGIGNQVDVAEGFGILAMASVMPILTVLAIGLKVTREKEAGLKVPQRNLREEGAAK
jgi:hypothetical protein